MTSGYPDYTKKVYDTGPAAGEGVKIAAYLDHWNGSVGTAAATVTLAATGVALLIENTHAAQNILVSFDAGTTWKTLNPNDTLSVDTSMSSFQIKGSAAATTYEILAGRV